jgi:hypothetical protein
MFYRTKNPLIDGWVETRDCKVETTSKNMAWAVRQRISYVLMQCHEKFIDVLVSDSPSGEGRPVSYAGAGTYTSIPISRQETNDEGDGI